MYIYFIKLNFTSFIFNSTGLPQKIERVDLNKFFSETCRNYSYHHGTRYGTAYDWT